MKLPQKNKSLCIFTKAFLLFIRIYFTRNDILTKCAKLDETSQARNPKFISS